jgi:HPr kinase/phosphorylase
MAVLVEVAVRNHVLLLRGVDSTRQFMQRQRREIKRNAMPVGEKND